LDLKTTVGLQYYFLSHSRFAPFLRGSLVYQAVNFKDPNDPEAEAIARTSQLGGELAAGLEWRAFRWLVFGADVAYVGLKRLGEDQEGAIPMDVGKGVPTVGGFEHGATFRFSMALRF
jgi:outer membrane protein W